MRAFALGLLAGVGYLQMQAGLPSILTLFVLFGVALAAVLWQRHAKRSRLFMMLLAGMAFGFAWAAMLAHWRLSDALPLALEEQDMIVTGTIASLPDPVERGLRFHFAVEAARSTEGQALNVPSYLMLGLYETARGTLPDLQPGERWQWTVRLRRPHGNANPYGFDYEAWLLGEGVRATGSVRPEGQQRLDAFVFSPRAVLECGRGALRDRIQQALQGKPYAGVIVALVMGDQRAVSQSDWTIFNRTGIGHLVSISGLHITMIAALFSALLSWLWRVSFFTRASLPLWIPAQRAAAVAGVIAALIYVALAGFGVPAQRTLVMLSVVALALWLGRITAFTQVLCAALIVVLMFDPWAVLWPGFWLSFAAIACILFASSGRTGGLAGGLASELTGEIKGEIKGELKGELISSTRWQGLVAAARTQYAVTVGLVPLSVLLFSQVSLVGPLANALAIPLVSFVVTPLSLLGSVLPAPLSGWLLLAAHGVVAVLAQALIWLAGLPLAVWQAPQPDALTFACAAAGMLWLLAPRGWPLRWLGLLGWLPLLLAQPTSPQQGLWLTAFDIGQGNALLIETASHRLLYDTGPAYTAESDSGTRVLLPYLRARGISRLDGVVVSHSDSDHSGGALSVLNGMAVGWLSSSLPASHPVSQRGPNHHACATGQSWSWDGVQFEMLQPTSDSYAIASLKPNARSCTLKISYGEYSVLLAGDIEAAQERALLERLPQRLPATILLAPHHGSGTSSTPAFLAAVQPQIALFQVGYRNRYHHPKPEVYARYAALGIQRLRTDELGAVQVLIDESVTLKTYRFEHLRYWQGR